MPEGHTVHRLARDHAKWFAGQRLKVSSPQGRFLAESRLLDGTTLRTIEAHGKHHATGFYTCISGCTANFAGTSLPRRSLAARSGFG